MANHGMDRTAMTRRRFIVSLATAGIGLGSRKRELLAASSQEKLEHRVARLWDVVVPPGGYNTSMVFGNAILRLVQAGVVDAAKFRRLYEARGGLPPWVERLFVAPSGEPIRFSRTTAPYLLIIFWPLGLATKTSFNSHSPLNRVSLPSFASTACWNLGQANNGYVYFNHVETIRLSQTQEHVVLNIARKVFRPCCNNSTFFQDCNHGSALLGVLELAASQGRARDKLYRLARVANAYWYPTHYVEIALYFQEIKSQSWPEVAPETVLSRQFSSVSGWRRNIHIPLQAANLLPRRKQRGQSGCSV